MFRPPTDKDGGLFLFRFGAKFKKAILNAYLHWMSLNDSLHAQMSLVPLGPGDLIDRAIRYYRGNLWTFVLIASPPVIVGTIVSVGWTMLSRSLFAIGSTNNPAELLGYYLFVWLGALVIWFIQAVAMLSVMGGASRNFVRHLLFSERLTFRETYRNTWRRLGELLVASSIMALILGVVGIFIFYIGLSIGAILVIFAAAALSMVPPLAFLVGLVLGIATTVGTVWLFFLVASRFAYVPQVMLVEGQGVFSSISRSAGLASGNVRRLAALFIFSLVATYSALAIFYIPLLLYAWWRGVDVFNVFAADSVPAWYEIASQLIWQASLILLTPVWMVGLCLLYVDERVRHEGYDIELMAARRLGEIPAVPHSYVNPLQPALAVQKIADAHRPRRDSGFTTLDLK